VKLSAIGREYAHIPVVTAIGVSVEVSFDNGLTWNSAERPSDTEARVLVAGPDAQSNPAGTVVLDLGRHPVHVRVLPASEDIIRPVGYIQVCLVADL
jgi:hypothetical protein